MTDIDSAKLDKILKKIEWMTEAIQGLAVSMNDLPAKLQKRELPAPPPKPLKRP